MAVPRNIAESDKPIEESQEMTGWNFPPSPPDFPQSSLPPPHMSELPLPLQPLSSIDFPQVSTNDFLQLLTDDFLSFPTDFPLLPPPFPPSPTDVPLTSPPLLLSQLPPRPFSWSPPPILPSNQSIETPFVEIHNSFSMVVPTNIAESDKAIEKSEEMNCWNFTLLPTNDFLQSPSDFPPSPPPFPPSPTDIPPSSTDFFQSSTDVPWSVRLPFSSLSPRLISLSNQSTESPQFQQHDIIKKEMIYSLCLDLQSMQLLPGIFYELPSRDLSRRSQLQKLQLQLPLLQMKPPQLLRPQQLRRRLQLLQQLRLERQQPLRQKLQRLLSQQRLQPPPKLLQLEPYLQLNWVDNMNNACNFPLEINMVIKMIEDNSTSFNSMYFNNQGNTAEEAIIAHDQEAYMLRGRHARISFPELMGVSPNFLDKNRAELTAATIMDILPSPAQQENNLDEDFVLGWSKATGNDEIKAVGIEGEGRGEDEMAVVGLNSSLGKGKRKVKTVGEEKETKKSGVRIAIPLEDIQQRKEMSIMDAAMDLKVSKSTLKRVCRDYGIPRWPPRENNKIISNSLPAESLATTDQEEIPRLNYDILTPNQALPIVDTNNVNIKVRSENGDTIKFRLFSPWRKVELEHQVERRLELKTGTYSVKYKDQENDLILISCDDDLEDCISCPRSIGVSSIEVFLEPKKPI